MEATTARKSEFSSSNLTVGQTVTLDDGRTGTVVKVKFNRGVDVKFAEAVEVRGRVVCTTDTFCFRFNQVVSAR